MKKKQPLGWMTGLVVLVALGGCQTDSPGMEGAAVGAAAGTGIGLVTGSSFGGVVGAGLIGGATGYTVDRVTSD
jgi:hypothetical protein